MTRSKPRRAWSTPSPRFLAPRWAPAVVNLPRVESGPASSERNVLDLDRGGEPLYFRPVQTGEGKEQIYLEPQRRFWRIPLVSHLFQVSLLFENAILKKTHLLLFIYNRNRLRRINFLSTDRQQHLKTRTLCAMLIIIKKKSHYSFLEFSWSAALFVSNSLPRPLLSIPNSTALLSLLNSTPLLSLLFVARQSRGALRGSHEGRCAAVTWGVVLQYFLRNLVAHRLLNGRRPLRDSHMGRCATVTSSRHYKTSKPLCPSGFLVYVSVCLFVSLLVRVVLCQSKCKIFCRPSNFDVADIVKFSRYQKAF